MRKDFIPENRNLTKPRLDRKVAAALTVKETHFNAPFDEPLDDEVIFDEPVLDEQLQSKVERFVSAPDNIELKREELLPRKSSSELAKENEEIASNHDKCLRWCSGAYRKKQPVRKQSSIELADEDEENLAKNEKCLRWCSDRYKKKEPLRKQSSLELADGDEDNADSHETYSGWCFDMSKKKEPLRKKSPAEFDEENNEDGANQETYFGLCFDTSCVWLFGEPTEALDYCGCMECEDYCKDKSNSKTETGTKDSGSLDDIIDDLDETAVTRRWGAKRYPRLKFPFRRSCSNKNNVEL